MKNPLIFLFLLFCVQVYGQKKINKGSYQFTTSELIEFSPQKENIKGTNVPIIEGSKITVLKYSSTDSLVYYRYWIYKDSNSENYNKYNSSIFTMKRDNFINLMTPLYPRYKGASVGVYTIPFRLRGIGADFDFESSLSLQSNLVFGFGATNSSSSSFDLSLGIGLTSINLNEKNSSVTSERTASAFTVSLGAVWKPAEFANIGLFLGWDNLGANDNDVNWKYNGKSWLGLGINISFNQIKSDKSAKVKTQE